MNNTKILGYVTQDDVRSLELSMNKTDCAKQALRPDAVPPYAPTAAKEKFFKEAIFAYADAIYLQDFFWRNLAQRHGIPPQDAGRLYIDFNTNELSLRDNYDTGK